MAFLNDLEAEELIGHVEGVFGLPYLPTLEELSSSLNRLIGTTRQARAVRIERLTDPQKETYSETDTKNIAEQDAAAEGAMGRLSELLDQIGSIATELRTADTTQTLASLWQALEPSTPVTSKERNGFARATASHQVEKLLRWKIRRLVGEPSAAPTADFSERVDRLDTVIDDLQKFSALGPATRNPSQGVTFSNLVNAKILLSGELEPARASVSGGLEEVVTDAALSAAQVQRQIRGEFEDASIEAGIYGVIFAGKAGLSVGATWAFAGEPVGVDGQKIPLARRYVVENSKEADVLIGLGVLEDEIIRADDSRFGGDVGKAILIVQGELEGEGLVVLKPIRGDTLTADLLREAIQGLVTILEPQGYDPVSAERIAQQVYDLFV